MVEINVAAERAYPTPFANSPLLPLLLLSLAKQKNTPQGSTKVLAEYDYVVVGAGSGGAVVASRLSEIPCVSVLLLEAGKPPPLLNDVPAIGRDFWFSDIDWAYKTVPQRHTGDGLANRQVIWPSGKALGGSSIMNGMLFVRCNRKNYDDWEAQGAKGWGYKDLYPYFLKMEDNQDSEYLKNGYHATSGPVTFQRPRYSADFKDSIFEAAEAMGYKVTDPNGYRQTGFYDNQASIRDGQRCSTAKAYLVPAENRTNFDILPYAFVRKVSIENRRAVGVLFDYDGKTYEVKAKKEVIMSAGTINSAQLLMLSGIGPKDHLQEMNIPVIADLPVGKNLQDHIAAISNFEVDPSIRLLREKLTDPGHILEYINQRTGPLTSSEGISAMAFLNGLNLSPKVDFPDYELYFMDPPGELTAEPFGMTPEVFQQVYGPYENSKFYLCFSSLLNPKSRGTVRLNSSDPYDPPLIDPNYLAHQEDVYQLVEGLKTCHRVGISAAMQKVGSRPFKTLYPGCERYVHDLDRYLECQTRSMVITLSHQVGTTKMGDPDDPTTVVDPELRVKGIQGLRVVDGSVIPIVPSGNTNVPIIVLAEKASDIIKKTIKCRPRTPPKYRPNKFEPKGPPNFCAKEDLYPFVSAFSSYPPNDGFNEFADLPFPTTYDSNLRI